MLDQAFKEVTGGGTAGARRRLDSSRAGARLRGRAGDPHGIPADDRLHAPNEKLELKQLWDGIAVFGRFYQLLGKLGTK